MRRHTFYVLLFLIVVALLPTITPRILQNFRLIPPQKTILHTNTTHLPSLQIADPERIIIPVIGIDTKVQQVGITDTGAMEVPSNTTDVGWYKYGVIPGQIGSAVIDGHYDGVNGTSGIFEKLHLLKMGDTIYIKDSHGKMITFMVKESRRYNPEADASEVFNQSDSSNLNLITCDGKWDTTLKSYSKRLVIFTRAVL